MQFISVRDLREKSAQIWEGLSKEREMVVTSNGKPIAILSNIPDGEFEESLKAIRRARAMTAAEKIQTQSVKRGLNKMSLEEINKIIKDVRKNRPKQ